MKAVLVALLLLPGVALASDGSVPFREMGWHLANLILLVGVVVYFGKGPVMNALKSRRANITAHLEESHRLRKGAQDRFDDLDAKLQRFGATLEQMREDAQADAEVEAAHIAAKSLEDVERIKSIAEKTIRDETSAARASLKRDAVELAVTLAENQLKGSVSAADQDRLARELLGTMKEMNGHG